MIAIEQPEVEALIQQRLAAGHFDSIEAVLLQALRDAPLPTKAIEDASGRTGADLIAAFQKCPTSDFEFEFESYRHPMPVREIDL